MKEKYPDVYETVKKEMNFWFTPVEFNGYEERDEE